MKDANQKSKGQTRAFWGIFVWLPFTITTTMTRKTTQTTTLIMTRVSASHNTCFGTNVLSSCLFFRLISSEIGIFVFIQHFYNLHIFMYKQIVLWFLAINICGLVSASIYRFSAVVFVGEFQVPKRKSKIICGIRCITNHILWPIICPISMIPYQKCIDMYL